LYKKIKRWIKENKQSIMDIFEKHRNKPYPKHVAFIMDGNGRWAKELEQERSYGHMMGAVHLVEIITDCFRNGTQFLTFFVFAEQNWKRPPEEIKRIFEILYKKIKILDMEIDYCNFRILVQGRLDRVPKKLRTILERVQEKTKDKEKTVIIALDYSGRQEIIRACKRIMASKSDITQDTMQNHMYVKNIPDPDLIIRTGGEKRISDFLLWQLCNSELYFTDVYWPDFDIVEFKKAIADYQSRERRYGNISRC